MKKIHNFSVKWIDKFGDQNINYIELVDHYMADDCVALGFEMDCGKAFEQVYGNAVYDQNVPLPIEKTKQIIRKCTEDNS